MAVHVRDDRMDSSRAADRAASAGPRPGARGPVRGTAAVHPVVTHVHSHPDAILFRPLYLLPSLSKLGFFRANAVTRKSRRRSY